MRFTCSHAAAAACLLAVALFLPQQAQARVSLNEINDKLNKVLANQQNSAPLERVFLRTLVSGATSACGAPTDFEWRGYKRIYTDNTPSVEADYVVPAGKTLVIYDIHWTGHGFASDLAVNRYAEFRLAHRRDGFFRGYLHISPSIIVTDSNKGTSISGNESLSAGIDATAGNTLCGQFVNPGPDTVLSNSYLRGVLMDTP